MDRLKARIFRHVKGMLLKTDKQISVSYTHLTLPTIYSV